MCYSKKHAVKNPNNTNEPQSDNEFTPVTDRLEGIIREVQQERSGRGNQDTPGPPDPDDSVRDGVGTNGELSGAYEKFWRSGGARMFNIDGKIVFLSQAESYLHRSPYFSDYAPIEFESIVDLCLRDSTIETTKHLLYPHYEGCIRAKFKTPMLGGAPLPSYTATRAYKTKMNNLARLLLATFTPWTSPTNTPEFELSTTGLQNLCQLWDNHAATFLQRQRHRSFANILKRGHRSSSSGRTYSYWRSRNADRWKSPSCFNIARPEMLSTSSTNNSPTIDMEIHGMFAVSEDVFQLINLTIRHKKDAQELVQGMRLRF
ncbi:hypothetical protein L917_13592 [Phytophthora nicotianae]|uniref:Uncharacterized protein n=2 Tax=Phytophthora nicotianae TaxID=4792 RepID=W2KPJ9_PHYNI|nr:hypothetical protein L917_13592 [Phytophthora nicotianae]ETO71900.1 hypothetical protein F444_11839 [Phytophthora nicotianae P1976]